MFVLFYMNYFLFIVIAVDWYCVLILALVPSTYQHIQTNVLIFYFNICQVENECKGIYKSQVNGNGCKWTTGGMLVG